MKELREQHNVWSLEEKVAFLSRPEAYPDVAGREKVGTVVSRRLCGLLYSPTLEEYKPITTKEKFKIATEDSFDPGTAVLAALFVEVRPA